MRPARNFFNVDNLINMALKYVKSPGKAMPYKVKKENPANVPMEEERKKLLEQLTHQIDPDRVKAAIAKFAAQHIPE